MNSAGTVFKNIVFITKDDEYRIHAPKSPHRRSCNQLNALHNSNAHNSRSQCTLCVSRRQSTWSESILHNDSSNPLAGGFVRSVSTTNTTQSWRSHPQGYINFTGRLSRDFYLHPDLAGAFAINGTVWLHPWVVGSGTGGSVAKASFTVALYDVSPSGQVVVGTSPSSASLDVAFGNSAAQSTDVNGVPGNAPLKLSVGSYTFLAGHSILVHVEMLPQGAGTVLSFYFDNQVTPSYVSLYSQNIVTRDERMDNKFWRRLRDHICSDERESTGQHGCESH